MMNERHRELFNNLETLVRENEAFYRQEFALDGHRYWIYNYRLASYTDFLKPDALECRGIMFEVDANDQAVRLASWPMSKFFNLNENPMVIGLDLSQIDEIQEKADGSLMSTYNHRGALRLKSKGSLFSDQALAAMKWLEVCHEFRVKLHYVMSRDYTVNLEWCSPEHRIVLGYMNPTLKVLNVRDNKTGLYKNMYEWFAASECVDTFRTNDPVGFVDSIKGMTDVEGFVLRFHDGLRVKVKCEWYMSLHHAKDSVNNPRRLFEAILDEGIDDLRSLFYTDAVAMKMIDEMQIKVDHTYNSMVKMVESFYEENKHLDRKSYAIKGQEHFKGTMYFGLAMNKYVGKPTDYKMFLKGKWKELGLKDTSVADEIVAITPDMLRRIAPSVIAQEIITGQSSSN